jgi:hypothetical protein
MFGIAAIVVFALALILDLANAQLGDAFTNATLVTLGLLLLTLHLVVPVAVPWRRG